MIYLPKIYNSDLSLNHEEVDKLLVRIVEKLDEREFGISNATCNTLRWRFLN